MNMLTIMKMPVCINLSAMLNETNQLMINDFDAYISQLQITNLSH
jgi:hypothetical protein